MTFWRNKKIKKIFFTFFQWQKQPSIDWTITLSTCFGGRCKAKNTAFHSKRNLEEMYDKCWTPNLQPQSRKFVKKKKNQMYLNLKKKPKVCSCASAFSQPSRQPFHQISLRYNVVSLAWLCSSPPLLVSVCYVCICDCFQYVLYSVL